MDSKFLPGRKLIEDNGNVIGASDGDIYFRETDKSKADELVKKYHYSHKVTKNTWVSLDICDGKGVIQLGGGIRPQSKGELSTLCTPNEIAEFDRMWLDDSLPRFSESKVIGLMFFYIKHKYPEIQFIITYADESAGQKGTIYQATGAVELEGRFVDFYLLPNGERLHPVSAWHRHKTRAFATLENLYPGIIHIQGGRVKGNHPDEILSKYKNMRQRKYIYAISKKARFRLAEFLKSKNIIPDAARQLSHHFKINNKIEKSIMNINNQIKIVNIKDRKSYDIYCGRANKTYGVAQSKWANPFVIGPDGTREEVIEKYRLWINCQPDLLEALPELRDKTLCCWCNVSEEKCHCEVLIKLSESKYIQNWFSNMLPFEKSLIYQGIEYKSVENFYQAMKLPKDRLDWRAELAGLSAFKSKSQIRDAKYTLRTDYQNDKLRVMEYALRYKFAKGTDWLRKLMLTKEPNGAYYEIVEWVNWNDKFWGKDIKTREGENNLGKLLMKIREENK